ncbi:MAG: acetyl-CoA carboxylase biotin carboxyl carrier protein [Rhodospirillaceae bacterium]|jgi:acetyl-CoA carboxylase biotin carboxyl carrier protein|nr:acetyl-CoA carboxylase biotin carboxyl carrier protein [Rhodospirillaceae bacterium]MBT5374921.1 acetyl-CoA carboxylase biotin carboxyl carrier protein [Rhodospirillaceae bacterium]MBT5658652.1 acetyl-CoA carboxylase biotin carboxyl carrier protein [Rhodospirillaceae bacterium]MBT5752214.1 acetyl-CoA carboxylase biotin carboxyl carrier protein [Rhodospirillaceae bacterium]
MAKFDIDGGLIRKLSKLLEETDLTEIEFESEGQRIRVARNSGGYRESYIPVAETGKQAGTAEEQAEKTASAKSDHPGAITSPMVGTAYVASEPESPPFVKVGDKIREGQTLIIVEAMKTMNPVLALRDGTVKEILVENGDPVEFGEALMIIE